MSEWKIIIQIHYFLTKSDILNIHLTNLIHRIDDSIDRLNVNVSDTLMGVKFTVLKLP